EFISELQDSLYGRSCGITQKHAFLPRQTPCIYSGILVSYLGEAVYNLKIYILGKNIFSNPFGGIGVDFLRIKNSGFMIFLKYRTVRIHTPNLDIRILFLEVGTYP